MTTYFHFQGENNMKRISVLIAVLIVISILLTACGGSSGADPVSAVKDLMQAVQDKKFDQLGNLVCAAQKDALIKTFDPSASLGGSGIDVKAMLDAMIISTSGIEYTKKSESGDKAVVAIKGNMTLKIDRAKFKPILQQILKAQGQDVTDEQLNQFMDMAASSLEKGQDLSQDMAVVKENGKWVVCK
jgi:predicted small secreted protein